MLIGYFKGSLSAAISTNSGSAAFLTDSDTLFDGRSGMATSASFSSGSAVTGRYTRLAVTQTSDLDATPPWGVVGLVNVQGLPEGTKCVFNGVTQRLVAGKRGELSAWWIPSGVTGATENIDIYNDVNGVASITPGATFAVGEVYTGRIVSLKTLAIDSPPAVDTFDQSAGTQTSGGQDWQLRRKNRRQVIAKLGRFTIAQAHGGSASDLVSGANPAGVIDLETLLDYLGETGLCAVCDYPSEGRGAGSLVNGIRFDQTFMQRRWMLARPTQIGQITRDQPPFHSVQVAFQEAT